MSLTDKGKEIVIFARLAANQPEFRAWLVAEKADADKYLVNATDQAVIFRAQGKAQFINTLLRKMDLRE